MVSLGPSELTQSNVIVNLTAIGFVNGLAQKKYHAIISTQVDSSCVGKHLN